MGKELEVIFTEDRKGYFRIGQKKSVTLGYARNFLFPRNLAVLVTPQNEKRIVSIEKKANDHMSHLKTLAIQLKETLDNQVLTLEQKVHDEGKLYGSVSAGDIASELNRNFESSLDKHDIKLSAPIREIGEYVAQVTIHPDISIQVKIVVTPEEEKKEEKKVAKAKKRAKADDESEESEQPKKRAKAKKGDDE